MLNRMKSKRQFIATFLWRLMPSILVEPPLARCKGEPITLVRKTVMEFLNEWAGRVYGDVLEIGAGSWDYTRSLIEKKCHYVAVDCVKLPNIDVVIDAVRLSERFGDNYCDFIICMDVLEHLEDPFSVIEEIYQVLKPGGRLLLSTPFNYKLHHNKEVKDYWRFSEDGLKKILYKFANIFIKAHGYPAFPYCYTVVAEKPLAVKK